MFLNVCSHSLMYAFLTDNRSLEEFQKNSKRISKLSNPFFSLVGKQKNHMAYANNFNLNGFISFFQVCTYVHT